MVNKTGRPKALFSSRLKTWFWYCAVKEITGLKDARLDVKYCRPLGSPPATRQDYLTRVKAFEIIRLKGGEITRINSGSKSLSKRTFDLLYYMSAYPEVKKTVALYEHDFWEYLSETELSIDRCISLIFESAKKLNLKSVDWPTDSESQDIEDILGALDSWEEHTDVPESAFQFSKSLIIFDLLDPLFELVDLNIDHLNRFLQLLTLLGVLYRYCYLRGRLHAALAVEEYLTKFVLELRELPWLEREFLIPGDINKKTFLFSEVFFGFVYEKITSPGGLISAEKLKTSDLKFNRRIKFLPSGSPMNEFLSQFK